ncbi:MAG: serine hydrolase domain-containing protein [Candidatus Odinarchaeota archaeon]
MAMVMLLILIVALTPLSNVTSILGFNSPTYRLAVNSLQEEDNQAFNSNIDDTITQFMQEGHIPILAACVVHKDRMIWSKGYGEQSNGNNAFIIGSITKTFTVTALLQLHEQGLFDLDEDVNNFLPFSLRNPGYLGTPITFRQLLLHQSSLLRGGELYQSYVYNDLDQQLGLTNETLPAFPAWLDDVLLSEDTSEIWGSWAPGIKQERLAYSNVGFDLLGYLVELISNQTIEDYFQLNIFGPLNMTKTHYTYQSYSSDELASPNEWIPDEENVYNYPTDENSNHNPPHYNSDELGAGALRSTATDLSHYLIAHMNNGLYKNKRILSKASIRLIHDESQVYYGNKQYDSYGFGWINDKINTVEMDGETFLQPLQGHSGSLYGFNSLMFFNQDVKLGVILLVNQGFNFVPGFYNLWEIFDVLYKEGLRVSISRSENTSGFSFFLFSLTLLVQVIFMKFRNIHSKKRREND